jgi:L-fuculose-phosphate aldolase
MYELFQKIGNDLLAMGLVTSHGGNISVREGDEIIITRRGSMLGHLKEDSIVKVCLKGRDANALHASMEFPVHRAIYQKTSAKAIIHAHPTHVTALSLISETVKPKDSEGAILLGEVPVITPKKTVGSKAVAMQASEILKDRKVVMVRAHGCFAVGQSLEEALCYTSTLEASCHITLLLMHMGQDMASKK